MAAAVAARSGFETLGELGDAAFQLARPDDIGALGGAGGGVEIATYAALNRYPVTIFLDLAVRSALDDARIFDVGGRYSAPVCHSSSQSVYCHRGVSCGTNCTFGISVPY